ncbi:hypothetical protein ES705_34103 [subsurface metagenome]
MFSKSPVPLSRLSYLYHILNPHPTQCLEDCASSYQPPRYHLGRHMCGLPTNPPVASINSRYLFYCPVSILHTSIISALTISWSPCVVICLCSCSYNITVSSVAVGCASLPLISKGARNSVTCISITIIGVASGIKGFNFIGASSTVACALPVQVQSNVERTSSI